MKAIRTNIVIKSIRSRKDKSVSFSSETPELSNDERNVFFDLQGINCDILLKPLDEKIEDTIKVDKDIRQKSQSSRIYSILYIIWKRGGEKGDFRDYYQRQTEKIINKLKTYID